MNCFGGRMHFIPHLIVSAPNYVTSSPKVAGLTWSFLKSVYIFKWCYMLLSYNSNPVCLPSSFHHNRCRIITLFTLGIMWWTADTSFQRCHFTLSYIQLGPDRVCAPAEGTVHLGETLPWESECREHISRSTGYHQDVHCLSLSSENTGLHTLNFVQLQFYLTVS